MLQHRLSAPLYAWREVDAVHSTPVMTRPGAVERASKLAIKKDGSRWQSVRRCLLKVRWMDVRVGRART